VSDTPLTDDIARGNHVVRRVQGQVTSAVLIAIVGFMYFAVAIDQAFIHHNFWNGLIWFGYAVAQIGLWHVTVQP
jgi:hypothetical protein